MTDPPQRRRPPAKPRPASGRGDAASATKPKATKANAKAKASAAKRKRRSTWRVWMRRLTFATVLLGVTAVGLGFVALNSVKIPDPTRTIKTTSFVCLADVGDGQCAPSKSVAQFSAGGNNRVLVSLDDISGNLINAVVAAEDRSFFSHGGVDPWGIARALYRDLRGSASRQGGSTITQQYVKQVYLTADRTPERKLKEAAIAIKLERKLSKREILERYLNEVPLGRGAIGVEAAARAYFDKDASDLDVAESAYLAGLIRAPRYADDPSDPAKPEEGREAKRRRHTVLVGMVEEKFITAAQADAADKTPFEGHVLVSPPPTATGPLVRPGFAGIGGKYIIEWVRQQLRDMPSVGETALLEQGLRVYLTIDPRLQMAAQNAIASTLKSPDDPSSAMVSVDDSGRIVAMIGGQDYDQQKVNLALGQAGGGSGRGPGSTFKPIALAEYVAEGNSVKSKLYGPAQFVFPGLDNGGPWTVDNYENKDMGLLTVEQATWQSVNTVYAQIMNKITPQKFSEMAAKLGITAKVKAEPSSVLGTSDVSVMDMATAYSTFANHGTLKPPYIVRRVEAADSTVLYDAAADPAKQPAPAIDPTVADTVSSVLTGVLSQPLGTGYKARLKTKAAAKTGTTGDYRDAWFAGYTCRVTAVVWMGFNNAPGQATKLMDNVEGKKVTGGSFPADIWKKYMEVATDGARGCSFKAPPDTGVVNPPDEAFAPTTTVPPPADGAVPPAGATPGTPAAPGATVPTTAPASTAPPAGGTG